jgi:hypothetical protein
MRKFLASCALVAVLGLAFTLRAAGDEPKPLATAKQPNGLVVELLEVKFDDAQEMLKIVWRYQNPTKKTIRLVEPSGPFVVADPPFKQFWQEVSYSSGKLETAKAYRHSVLRTADGKYYNATEIRRTGIVVLPGGTFEVFARFSRPAPGTEQIHVSLPGIEPFENVRLPAKKVQ